VAAVEEAVSGIEDGPSVFYELDATDPANPWTTGSGTFIDYVITTVRATNAAADLQGAYAQISSEQLIAVNPDVILLADAMYGETPEGVAERAGWEGIQAVVDGAVYPFDPFILSVPGPRLVDGLEEVARLLYPDLFE
jgi:iron complex transport system substrate-binding protein